jgi:hypothetical protein
VTNPHNTPPLVPAPTPVGWWDRAAIIALGGAGCALSYDALQQMAVAIHVRPQLSYLFPLVIDGFIAYGIRALLVMSTAPLRARLYTWTLFATATTASIWANALHAVRLNQQTHNGGLRLGDHVVAVLSTIAPLALAGAVHLYILITRHHPARETKKDQPGSDQPTTLVAVRADPDGTIRTGPHDPRRHAVRADHTHDRDHDLKGERSADQGPDERTSGPDHRGGPDQVCGPQRGPDPAGGRCGPADHAEAGPDERTSGPSHPADQNTADQEPTDQAGGDHRGPNDQGRPVHDTATPDAERSLELADYNPDPTDRPRDHAEAPVTEPQVATRPAASSGPEATAPDPEEVSAGRPASHGPVADQGGEASTLEPVSAAPSAEAEARTEVRADQNGKTDRDRPPADHAGNTNGDHPPLGTSGPNHPADHAHRGDRPGGPADHESGPPAGTSGPNHRADHEPGDHHAVGDRGPAPETRTGPEPEGVGDQPHPRTADRTGTGPVDAAPEASDAAGLEELLSIARKAALSEGRMTRRALRPYLNEAGVPISNRRFTELQRHLYADPTLAHLPRPGRRP